MTPPNDAGAGGAPAGENKGAPPAGGAPAGGAVTPPAGGAVTPPAAGGAATPPAGGWSPTWREEYAKDDKSKLAALGRYETPQAALDAMFAGRAELSKIMGQLPPGKDASAEQVKAWRTSQGVPEKAEGYFEKLDKGIVFGEADKKVVMNYLAKAHERGDSPAQVAENLAIYHQANLAAVEQMNQSDNAARTAFDTHMKEALGAEYTDNMGRFQNLIETVFPKEIKQALMNARLGDEKATPLMLSPGFVRSMIQMARTLNPTNANLPGGHGADVKTVQTEIDAYEKGDGKTVPVIGSRAWYKDDKAQARYRELVDMRDSAAKRAAK